MNKKHPILLAIVLTLSALVAAVAQEQEPKQKAKPSGAAKHKMVSAAEMQWGAAPPALPAGAEMVVLDGDPSKKGSFTVRLKMPAGYKIPPHTHPAAERVTVISGAVYLGMGEKLDEAAARECTPGSFAFLPANVPHYAFTSVETVLQIHSEGPFALTPVGAADETPKKK